MGLFIDHVSEDLRNKIIALNKTLNKQDDIIFNYELKRKHIDDLYYRLIFNVFNNGYKLSEFTEAVCYEGELEDVTDLKNSYKVFIESMVTLKNFYICFNLEPNKDAMKLLNEFEELKEFYSRMCSHKMIMTIIESDYDNNLLNVSDKIKYRFANAIFTGEVIELRTDGYLKTRMNDGTEVSEIIEDWHGLNIFYKGNLIKGINCGDDIIYREFEYGYTGFSVV